MAPPHTIPAAGIPPGPSGAATPAHSAPWLASLSAEGKKPTTLSTYLAAVTYWHLHSLGPNPARCSEVRQLLAGLSRQAVGGGFNPRQAAPLRRHHVEQIAGTAGIS